MFLPEKKNDNDVTGIAHNSDVVFASWRPTVEADWGTQLSELHALNTTLVSDPKVINCSFGTTYTSEAEFTTERAIEQMQLDANEEMGQEIFDAERYYTLYNTYDEFRQAQDNSFNERSKLIAAATCEIIKNRENDLDKDFLIVQAAGNGMDNRGPGIDAWYSSEWAGVTAENAKEACESTGVSYADLKDHFIIAGGNTMIENGDVYTMEPYYNYGEAVDIYAPGVNIYSTASRQEGSSGETSDYAITQGTSFSAPIVSGVAALVWSVDPTLTAGEVKDILLNNYTCTAQGTFSGETYTAPVVDAYESVKAAVKGLDSVLGRVVEADTDPKVPLQNVTVTVSDASGKEMSTVTTAETGAFTAIVDEPGTYTLTFSKDGYETVVKTDVKIQGRGTIGDIEMPKVGSSGAVEYGNTNSNAQNEGLVVTDGEWIYYTDLAYNELYKMKEDGSQKTKISDGYAVCLNLIDDWLYFSSFDGIYKMRTDGTNKTKLENTRAAKMIVVGDWIYYSAFDNSALWRVKTDGTNATSLGVSTTAFSVIGDTITYAVNDTSTNYYTLYLMETNGTNKFSIAKFGGKTSQLCSEDEKWFYYTLNNGSNPGKIIKTNAVTDMLIFNQELLTTGTGSIRTSSLNVYDGWMYYFSNEDEPKICRIKTDGSAIEEIGTATYTNGVHINVIDDWVYYASNGGFLFRMKTDGSNWEQVAPVQ